MTKVLNNPEKAFPNGVYKKYIDVANTVSTYKNLKLATTYGDTLEVLGRCKNCGKYQIATIMLVSPISDIKQTLYQNNTYEFLLANKGESCTNCGRSFIFSTYSMSAYGQRRFSLE